MIHPSVAVLEYHLVWYRRVWRGTVATSFGLPVLFLLAMGVTVGSFVDARGSLGVAYLDFIAPGLLASTALQVAVGEATWPVFGSFTWQRTYHAMVSTPVRAGDVLFGHIAYVQLRVLIAAAGFLAVMAGFGALHSARAPAALPAAVLVGVAVTAPAFAYSAAIRSDGLFALLFRFAVVPMTLFAGVFFPVASLPWVPRLLAYGSPLWHGVELIRAATLGVDTAWGMWTHIAYLALWAAVGSALAHRGFVKRLAA